MDPEKKEELESEIMALESIFPDEFTLIETEPFHKFEIYIKGQADIAESDNVDCHIHFEHQADYPDTLGPVFEFTKTTNLSDDQLEQLNTLINTTIDDNLGCPMVYTIVSAVQDQLHIFAEQVVERAQEIENIQVRAREEEEKKKFIGTQVTIETFMAWKAQFDAELAAEARKRKEAEVVVVKKMTGKEMFLANRDLDASDLAFLAEHQGDDVGVEVDESLFEELDDLDIGVGDFSDDDKS